MSRKWAYSLRKYRLCGAISSTREHKLVPGKEKKNLTVFAYKINICQVQWYTSAIPALRRLKLEDCKFKANLIYIARPCLNTHTHTHTHTQLKDPTTYGYS
jgi:hypothetical protein